MQPRIPLAFFATFLHAKCATFSAKLLSQTVTPWHVLVPEIVAPQWQDFALPLELHGVPFNPFFQLVDVPLDGSITLGYQPLLLVLCLLQA